MLCIVSLTFALAQGNNIPRLNSPNETPPIIPLNESASWRTGPNRSTANTNANESAPHPRHTHLAICQNLQKVLNSKNSEILY